MGARLIPTAEPKDRVARALVSLVGALLVLPAPTQGKALPPAASFRDCTEQCPVMVPIRPGSFVMGADAGEEGRPEGPAHRVTIARPYALGAYEVTNAEFAAFVTATGYAPSRGCNTIDATTGKFGKAPDGDFRHPGPGAGEGQPGYPVVCVSWRDARAYVGWLAQRTGQPYRLPSEAEWEYAARAGSTADYPWGPGIDTGCSHANVYDEDGAKGGAVPVFSAGPGAPPVPHARCRDGHSGAAPVGSYKPNAFGLYDMTGNVWEWVEDCYVAPYPADVPTDGRAYEVAGDCPRRAVRSGSWMSAPFRNRTSWRGRDPEDLVTWIFGFRVARDLPAGRGR